MFELLAMAVEENRMKDRNTGEDIILYKVFFKNSNGGFFCVWTPKLVAAGESVTLNILSDDKMKPVIKIA